MKIKNLQIEKSDKRVNLVVTLEFSSGTKKNIFLSVPKEYSRFISDSYDSFLASVLVPCMKINEKLEISGKVSSEFLESAHKVMKQLEKWNLGLKRISINAEDIYKSKKVDSMKSNNSALFFSGGVDSFYTYLRNKKVGKSKISHFIFVHGFDIRLEDEKMFRMVFRNIKRVANAEGVELIEVKTNIREFLDKFAHWDYSHGAAIAFVALALRNGFRKIYVSGGMEEEYAKKRPYGTHPDLDPLWSTSDLKFIHSGTEATRMQKIMKYISRSSIALKYLHVCWRGKYGQYNCGTCEKCIRSMLSLYSAGVLHKCRTLPSSIDKDTLSNLVVPRKLFRYYEENLSYLKKHRINDPIIPALEKCLEKNSKDYSFKLFILRIREYLGILDARYMDRRMFYVLSKLGYI